MKKVIVTNKLLTPQKYLKIVTGKYYHLNADNQLEEVEKILDHKFGKGAIGSYSLMDMHDGERKVHLVLVEIVNITNDCR